MQKYKMELQKLHEMNNASQGWFRNISGAPKDFDQEIRQRERIIDSMKLTIEKVTFITFFYIDMDSCVAIRV